MGSRRSCFRQDITIRAQVQARLIHNSYKGGNTYCMKRSLCTLDCHPVDLLSYVHFVISHWGSFARRTLFRSLLDSIDRSHSIESDSSVGFKQDTACGKVMCARVCVYPSIPLICASFYRSIYTSIHTYLF